MSTPAALILTTKLHIPPPPPKVVVRPRLVDRLNEGQRHKLTLISAPAGFGKTTLVSAWVADCAPRGYQHVAWLSLDESDGDPVRFLTYLVAALRTVVPNIGEGVLSMLQSPQPPPDEAILPALLNEITTLPHNLLLILDDYHVIDATSVDTALTFMLEHLPPQLHLVITTREDPQLPLARLRARDQMTELRAADLRFTLSEAAGFLNQAMGLDLLAEDIAALETRTEGWIAGLQLAAISLQGHEDTSGFIRAFAGDHRYITDYLVEEVLLRQPESVRSFLLRTSILDRLCAPLCEAVTGEREGRARLDALERGNFFVVPLDDKRQWYRYHHLFAEVLHAHLRAETVEQISTLHLRASEWYERNGLTAEAIRHALAAEDFERAASLIELEVPAMFRSRQEVMLLGWLRTLPDELFHCRPVLNVGYVGALMSCGKLEGVEDRLRDAERWLEMSIDMHEGVEALPADGDKMVVVDEGEFRRLPGTIAKYRAAQTLALGDLTETVKYARRALDLVPEDDHVSRGAIGAILGLAAWASGDLEAAHRSYAQGMAHLQKAGYIADTVGGAITLADIRIAQGRLHDALRTYEQSLQLATQTAAGQGSPVLRGTADMYVGMSDIHREHNDLNAATQDLQRSKDLGEHAGLPKNSCRWRVAMARVRWAQGDLEGALDLLHEAERLYVGDFSPNVRPVAAMKARVWIAQGRFGEAIGWVREHNLSAEDELSYLREFEHITLARLLLARHRSDGERRYLHEAQDLLERLLQAAEGGGRTGSVIEILVLQSLAYHAQGDTHAAVRPLKRALTLAEPEGYVRMFVDEDVPIAALLREVAREGIAPDYVHQLLAALEDARETKGKTSATQPLAEPLSERELEVLRLLETDLTGPEVAGELVVSLSTMRTHTRSIYSKLGVDNRRAAVRRAKELHLL